MEESNYYEILNIASTASFEEIRAAYKRQCKIFHPDVNKSIDATRQMQLVNEAYRVLHNQYLRAQYDKTISYYNSSAKASSYCENDECQESDDSFDPMRNWRERTEADSYVNSNWHCYSSPDNWYHFSTDKTNDVPWWIIAPAIAFFARLLNNFL